MFQEQHKGADHAGPVSKLEVPVIVDTPFTSESFERINAELKELRMQLQLLKMESARHADEPAPVTVEEDIAEVENYILGTEGWEVSYILDVLMHSGIEDSGLDMFGMMWYSPNCPLDPMLFDELEKKYSYEITQLRSERRLLFDGINSALLETFQQHMDSYSWTMPKSGRLHSTWQKEQVIEALNKLMNQEPIPGQLTGREIYNNMDWPDLREEIDIIGNDIEKLLIDDMITEILCC
ncbi:UNVERIFIED_CONTAM: protein TRM32 [Sesamum radiatum]|uniref:Protein TRM32 n=1 Tax=Sesamum radiatum TaxID=300843 RepID=A0AAW2NLF3_SESRA